MHIIIRLQGRDLILDQHSFSETTSLTHEGQKPISATDFYKQINSLAPGDIGGYATQTHRPWHRLSINPPRRNKSMLELGSGATHSVYISVLRVNPQKVFGKKKRNGERKETECQIHYTNI